MTLRPGAARPRLLPLATLGLLVVALGAASLYPTVAASRGGFPLPPDAVWVSLRGAGLFVALLAFGVWSGRRHRLAAWAAFVGTLLTVALGLALYAVALTAESPTAPLRALRLVPLRQLAAAAVTAYAVFLARRASP